MKIVIVQFVMSELKLKLMGLFIRSLFAQCSPDLMRTNRMMALLAVKIINLWKSASVVDRVAIVAEANLWQ